MAIATWNPLDANGYLSFINSDLTAQNNVGAATATCRADAGISSGKYYWECTPDADNLAGRVGVADSAANLANSLGGNANSWGLARNVSTGARVYYNTSSFVSIGLAIATGDVVGVALDMDNGMLWFSINGVWAGDPGAGTGAAISGLTGTLYPATTVYNVNSEETANFGATALTYPTPSGFFSGVDLNPPLSGDIDYGMGLGVSVAGGQTSDGIVYGSFLLSTDMIGSAETTVDVSFPMSLGIGITDKISVPITCSVPVGLSLSVSATGSKDVLGTIPLGLSLGCGVDVLAGFGGRLSPMSLSLSQRVTGLMSGHGGVSMAFLVGNEIVGNVELNAEISFGLELSASIIDEQSCDGVIPDNSGRWC